MAQQVSLVVDNFDEAEFAVNIFYGCQGILQSKNTWSCATATKQI